MDSFVIIVHHIGVLSARNFLLFCLLRSYILLGILVCSIAVYFYES